MSDSLDNHTPGNLLRATELHTNRSLLDTWFSQVGVDSSEMGDEQACSLIVTNEYFKNHFPSVEKIHVVEHEDPYYVGLFVPNKNNQ